MIALRLAALLQVAFLPGWLLLRGLGLEGTSALQTALRAFAASLLANFFLAFALTLGGLFVPAALWTIFVAECAAAAWLLRGARLPEPPRGPAPATAPRTWAERLALGAALASAAIFLAYAVQNRDAIFTDWDAVVSWNRWAVDWAENRLPRHALHYPQLVPASWAVGYVMAQDLTVQSFARMLQALYPLAVVLAFLDAGLRRGSVRLLLAAPVFAFILHRQVPPDVMSNGCVDVPVAALSLLAVVTALHSDDRSERTWWAALLVGCAAALCKQAGLFVLAFVWASAVASLRSRRFALQSGLAVLAVVGSWYGFKQAEIWLGKEASELSAVTVTVHFGRGAWERLERAWGFVQVMGGGGAAGSLAALAALALAAWAAVRDRVHRPLVLGVVLPYALIWAFLYSYDTRNGTLLVPLVALALVHGVPDVPAPRTRLAAAAWAAAGALAFGLATWDEPIARESQLTQQRSMGDAGLNAALYRFFGQNPIRGRVYTGYQYLGFLPGFRDRMKIKEGPMSLADVDQAERDPEVAYVMEPRAWMTPDAWAEVEARIRSGRYRHAFDQPSMFGVFRLVQLRP